MLVGVVALRQHHTAVFCGVADVVPQLSQT